MHDNKYVLQNLYMEYAIERFHESMLHFNYNFMNWEDDNIVHNYSLEE